MSNNPWENVNTGDLVRLHFGNTKIEGRVLVLVRTMRKGSVLEASLELRDLPIALDSRSWSLEIIEADYRLPTEPGFYTPFTDQQDIDSGRFRVGHFDGDKWREVTPISVFLDQKLYPKVLTFEEQAMKSRWDLHKLTI